jgi:hypothetical protein
VKRPLRRRYGRSRSIGHGPLQYVAGDKYVAVAVDHRGNVVGRWSGPSRAGVMTQADHVKPSKEVRVTVRTDHTSDGSYHGPGGGRVVASREWGTWVVDGGDSTTHQRAY